MEAWATVSKSKETRFFEGGGLGWSVQVRLADKLRGVKGFPGFATRYAHTKFK